MKLKSFAIYVAGAATVGLAWLACAMLSDMDDTALETTTDAGGDVAAEEEA